VGQGAAAVGYEFISHNSCFWCLWDLALSYEFISNEAWWGWLTKKG
jgi:hypothetical protein